MSARVSVKELQLGTGDDRHGDSSTGRESTTVAVKSATTAAEIERLAEEADRIRGLSHPGVVTFIAYQYAPDRAELHTLYVGSALDRWSGGLSQVAGLVAALATTVSDLHDAGVVHGRVHASHVLVRPDGRPVLCGLSPPPEGTQPSDDVAAVGELLRKLVADVDNQPGKSRWQRLTEPAAPRRHLALAAERATDPMPERRPTARALAQAVLDAVPDATLPDRHPPDDAPRDPFTTAFVDLHTTGEHEIFDDRPWREAEHSADQPVSRPPRPPASRRQRHAPAAAAVSCLALLCSAGAWHLWGGVTGNGQPDEATAYASGPDDCSEPTAAATSNDVTHEVDVTGDGCSEAVVVTAEGIVEIDGERWAVGDPDDLVTIGDWDCSGVATPALYRQATGDVFIFTEWADRGHPLRAEPVEQVPGGVSLFDSAAEVPTSARCDVPVVELASGEHHPVEVAPDE